MSDSHDRRNDADDAAEREADERVRRARERIDGEQAEREAYRPLARRLAVEYSRIWDDHPDAQIGEDRILHWLKNFEVEEIVRAMEIARLKVPSPDQGLRYAGGILKRWKQERW